MLSVTSMEGNNNNNIGHADSRRSCLVTHGLLVEVDTETFRVGPIKKVASGIY